ncbi:MFS transporter [Nonomuraea ceibae]|uniref:MFS transporter n=1 Tax=Nonomuraea ceibae TaxID=1935170 RepID=UPI001C5F0D47|nr:MFS transporter [Nonomuraea ceibae]
MRGAAAGLAVLFAVALTTITTETLPMGLLPQLSRGLAVTESWAGLLVGGYSLLIIATAVPLTTLTGRWDRRRLLLAVMALFAISNALLAAAPNYQVALLARLIAALGHGVLWSAMAGYAAGLVEPAKAGRAVAVVFAGNSAALTVGVPLGTLLGQAAGWRAVFAVLSGVSVLLVLAGRAVLPRQEGSARPVGAGQALRIPSVRQVAAATALVMLGHFTLHTYLVPYLGSAAAAPALFVFGLAGIAGVAAAGLLADRHAGVALPGCLGLLAAALVALPVTGGPATITVIAVWGLAYAALPTLLQTLALQRAPGAGPGASALFIIAFNAGITAGSLAGGQALAFLGTGLLPVVAVIPVLSALLVMWLGARRQARAYAAVVT